MSVKFPKGTSKDRCIKYMDLLGEEVEAYRYDEKISTGRLEEVGITRLHEICATIQPLEDYYGLRSPAGKPIKAYITEIVPLGQSIEYKPSQTESIYKYYVEKCKASGENPMTYNQYFEYW